MSQSPDAFVPHKPLAYVDQLDTRSHADITTVVIHCTELPTLADARVEGEKIRYDSGTGNSGHYYIDVDGRTECWVPPERIAHHVADFNQHSIGIELVNLGRYPDWWHSQAQQPSTPYPDVQIQALVDLLNHLSSWLPNLRHICGHEDIDTRQVPASDDPSILVPRKCDPGPMFPWCAVLSEVAQLQRLGGVS